MQWDQLFGFFIFFMIAVISVIGKIFEERKKNTQQTTRRQARPEDLPESTRRMLYGDGGEYTPPTARPRQTQTADRPPAVPTAVPRTAPPRDTPPGYEREARGVEERPTRRPERLPWEEPEQQQAPPPPPQRRPAPVQQPLQPARRQQQQPQPGFQSMEEAMLHAQAQRQRDAAKRQREADRQRVRAVHPSKRAAPSPARKAKRAGALQERGLRELLRDQASIRHGILLREILGPPKALN